MNILRFIASVKMGIILLILMAITVVFSIFGPQTPAFGKNLGLQNGLISWPFLSLLGLFLLQQLFASFVRIKQASTKRKDPFIATKDPVPDLPEEDDELSEFAPKPSKPLPHPKSMGEYRQNIDTLLPEKNATTLLETLGFKVKYMESEEASTKQIYAKKGGSTGFYTFLLHLGALVFIVGWVWSFAITPIKTTKIDLHKTASLGGETKVPLFSFFKSMGLTQNESWSLPPQKLSLNEIRIRTQKQYILRQPQKRWKRWKDSLDKLFLNQGNFLIHVSPVTTQTGIQVKLTLDQKFPKLMELHQGNSFHSKDYRISIGKYLAQANFLENGKKLPILLGKKHSIGNVEVIPLQHKVSSNCMVMATITSGQPTKYPCISVGSSLTLGTKVLKLESIKTGIKIHYQPKGAHSIIWIGLLLLLLGFIGYWWPKRYEVLLVWSGGFHNLTVKGNGLGVEPSYMARGISQTLFFPVSWISNHVSKAAAPPTPQPLYQPIYSPPEPAPIAPPIQQGSPRAQVSQYQQALQGQKQAEPNTVQYERTIQEQRPSPPIQNAPIKPMPAPAGQVQPKQSTPILKPPTQRTPPKQSVASPPKPPLPTAAPKVEKQAPSAPKLKKVSPISQTASTIPTSTIRQTSVTTPVPQAKNEQTNTGRISVKASSSPMNQTASFEATEVSKVANNLKDQKKIPSPPKPSIKKKTHPAKITLNQPNSVIKVPPSKLIPTQDDIKPIRFKEDSDVTEKNKFNLDNLLGPDSKSTDSDIDLDAIFDGFDEDLKKKK